MPEATWREEFATPEALTDWEPSRFISCTDASWIVTGVGVKHDSACSAVEYPEGLDAGSILRTREAEFDGGWLVARVYATDDDGVGLIYGVDKFTYYRASVDLATRLARLDLADTGHGVPYQAMEPTLDKYNTPLADALADTPQARWFLLAVRWAGGTHELYVDGQLVLTAKDSVLGPGRFGLYAYGMFDLRIDWIATYPDGPVPWEPLP